jgi:hypothetical protein
MTAPDTKAEGLEVVAWRTRFDLDPVKRWSLRDIKPVHLGPLAADWQDEPLVRLSDAQAMEARALAREAGLREALEPFARGGDVFDETRSIIPAVAHINGNHLTKARAALSREADHG